MAYSEKLAARIRKALPPQSGVTERRMFGGLGFLWQGNLCLGIMGDELIARIGPDHYERAMMKTGVRKFDITGRPMRGWVVVMAESLRSEKSLRDWIHTALEFTDCLPPKKSPRS